METKEFSFDQMADIKLAEPDVVIALRLVAVGLGR